MGSRMLPHKSFHLEALHKMFYTSVTIQIANSDSISLTSQVLFPSLFFILLPFAFTERFCYADVDCFPIIKILQMKSQADDVGKIFGDIVL